MVKLQCRICGDWVEEEKYYLAPAVCEECWKKFEAGEIDLGYKR